MQDHCFIIFGLNTVTQLTEHFRSGLLQSTSRSSNKATFLEGRFHQFTSSLIPLLLECWIEAKPSGGTKTDMKHSGKRKGDTLSALLSSKLQKE